MPEEIIVYDIRSVKREGGKDKFFNVGKITMFPDGRVNVRLNHSPEQEFRAFKREVNRRGRRD